MNIRELITNLLPGLLFIAFAIPNNSLANGNERKTGNPGEYEQTILLVADGVLDDPDDAVVLDPDCSFLRNEIGLNRKEIENFLAHSEAYFRDQFGLDFTQIPWENGSKVIPGVAQITIRKSTAESEYRAIYMGGKGINRPIYAGGLFVEILGTDVVYHGKFGGEDGKPAFPGDFLVSGFYSISQKNGKKPVIIRYLQGNVPTRLTLGGWQPFINNLFSSKWGQGIADGVATFEPMEDGSFRTVIRNVLTFPGRLPDAPIASFN